MVVEGLAVQAQTAIKMKTNKKSQISSEVIYIIPKIIFLTAVLFAVVILVKVFLITAIDVRQVESNVLVNRLLYSRYISYFDEDLKRVYPGVIDLNKFQQLTSNPNILDTATISYGSDNPIIAAKITLKQKSKDDVTIFYNKERFDKWEPRALSTVKGGAGSIKAFEYQKYVLVKYGEKLSPGILEFYIVG